MSIGFNSGGIITCGYGEDHKIITQGYSKRFERGGYRRLKIKKERELELVFDIEKIIEEEYNLNSIIEKIKESDYDFNLPVLVRREEEYKIKARAWTLKKILKILKTI